MFIEKSCDLPNIIMSTVRLNRLTYLRLRFVASCDIIRAVDYKEYKFYTLNNKSTAFKREQHKISPVFCFDSCWFK